MIHYPESVIRNARHLIQIGQAVLDGKMIEHCRPGPGGDHIWEPQNGTRSFLSTVYRSYRVASHQQLELPKGTRPMTPQRAKELAPVIAAYGEGKTIQYRQSITDRWFDYPNNAQSCGPTFDARGEYRIKPEPTLRPWKLEEIPAGAMVTCAHATVANQDGRDFLIVGATVPSGSLAPRLKTTRWFPNTEDIVDNTLDQMPGLRKWYWPNEPHILRPVGVLEEPK